MTRGLLGGAIAAVCLPLLGHRLPTFPSPKSIASAVFTSTRDVTCLAVGPDGAVWAGTTGGVIRRDSRGIWRKLTRLEGLPSHEVRGIVPVEGGARILFPTVTAVWKSEACRVETPSPMPDEEGRTVAEWRGKTYSADATGFRARDGDGWKTLPFPASRGTHITALLPRPHALWAAVYGDGIWAWNGRDWMRAPPELPETAREITALAAGAHGGSVWIGTRGDGVWEYNGRRWIQHLMPGEPKDHNIQALALYRGRLYAGTLEQGLVVQEDAGFSVFSDDPRARDFGHESPVLISSSAPRQMAQLHGVLYVRHGGGKVDAFDGERWSRDVCASLPRKQVTALAADSDRLYAAQWGGWSEYDGKKWDHFLRLPELQGIPVTCLLPDGERLWIGTQNRGLAEFDRRSGAIRWHDERLGMPDDWITCLARAGNRLWAGTFVGGLARLDGARWVSQPELEGQNVTALETDSSGRLYAATRAGVWRQLGDGAMTRLNDRYRFLDAECQALQAGPGGLWIGARTGLFFLRHSSSGAPD